MRGRLTLMTLALCAATLPVTLASPTEASAPAPTTCQGKNATIIVIPDDGTLAGAPAPGTSVVTRSEVMAGAPTGTPGPDVVVYVAGAWYVTTGAGDDLVCVVGGSGSGSVLGGEGDDTVDATQVQAGAEGRDYDVKAELGGGDDIYSGGPGKDWVSTGSGDDAVTTSAGDDTLNVGAPSNEGRADLGEGDDIFEFNGEVTGGVDGGSGVNELRLMFSAPGAVVDIDAALGLATVNSVITPIVGFTGFDFQGLDVMNTAPWESLRFRGSDLAETVRLEPTYGGMNYDAPIPTSYGRVSVDLGGGDDRLTHNPAVRGTMVGGAGEDEFATSYSWALPPGLPPAERVSRLKIDLAQGRFRVPGTEVAPSRLGGFEAVAVTKTSFVTVIGTELSEDVHLDLVSGFDLRMGAGADVVHLSDLRNCCDQQLSGRIDAGPGTDTVDASDAGPNEGRIRVDGGSGGDVLIGGTKGDQLAGGGGDDTLRGGRGRDVLDGGRGVDRADGGGGRDTCAAERRTGCETHH